MVSDRTVGRVGLGLSLGLFGLVVAIQFQTTFGTPLAPGTGTFSLFLLLLAPGAGIAGVVAAATALASGDG